MQRACPHDVSAYAILPVTQQQPHPAVLQTVHSSRAASGGCGAQGEDICMALQTHINDIMMKRYSKARTASCRPASTPRAAAAP
jgi:hypothetical protein